MSGVVQYLSSSTRFICASRTIDNIRQLRGLAHATLVGTGMILPTSPGGADSMNEAIVASFAGIAAVE
jgi:hypothetical protein